MKTNYGIQMYSLRDVTEKDLEGALRMVSEMGYKYVEFAGFFGHPAEDVKAWLDKYSLEVSGTHTGFGELVPEKLEETIAYHKAIGNKNIIVPGFNRTDEGLEDLISTLNYALPILKENGISLGYHNHSSELLPTASGRCYHKEIEERTEADFEIDTFWAYNAGFDPLELMEKFKNRMKVVHLKDGFPSEDKLERGAVGKSVGSGSAPVLEVIAKANELGMLLVVESEGLDPTGPEEVKRCIDFLKSIEK